MPASSEAASSEALEFLLTGASGFIGRRLIAELLAGGHEVAGASKEAVGGLPGFRSMTLDVADSSAVSGLGETCDPDVVIHLAGLANVGASWNQPDEYFRVNVLGTENVLMAFPRARVLLASSAEVYGQVPEVEQPLSENRDPAPVSPYALTKAAAERLVLAGGGTVMRLFTVIGPGQSLQFALPSFADQLVRIERRGDGAPLKVGNLAARRDWLHVGDVVEAIALLATRDHPDSIYNIGGGETASVRELLDRLIDISGVQAAVEVDEARIRPVDIPLLSADSSRLESLGWSPRRTVDDALRELWIERSAIGSESG